LQRRAGRFAFVSRELAAIGAVSLGEVIAMNGDVVEVILTWGHDNTGCVLATKYVHAGERFEVGEAEGCDAVVPIETLGEARASLVSCEASGAVVVPPRGSLAWVDGVPAACEPIALSGGRIVELEMGELTLRARLVEDERYASSFAGDVRAEDVGGFALSALMHVGVLAALALFLPALGATDDDSITRDQLLTMQHLINASAEREEEAKLEEGDKAVEAPEDHGASGGGRALGAAGTMGTEHAPREAGHWSAAGDTPRELAALSREQKLELVKDTGMIGLINTLASDPNAPTVPWGEILRGADRDSHLGGLFGPDAAESWGIGGLSIGGTDEGGGGDNIGIGVNDIGGLSASLDTRIGSHDPGGFGGCPPGQKCGRVLGTHHVGAGFRMPREIAINGRLPKEVIQRIIRQNMGRYRNCYESALRTNPTLEGRVAVQFVIDRTGAVSIAQDGDSDLPDASVRTCIVRSFYNLSFPAPQGGTVSVTYPMVLTPAQ
jgi:hypothetical protein